MMRNTEFGNKNLSDQCRHLRLVDDFDLRAARARRATATDLPISPTVVRQLTLSMMNRLLIPHTTSIVGLLDVGLSRTNFDELSKWIPLQLSDAFEVNAANELPYLERRFRHIASQFPEL